MKAYEVAKWLNEGASDKEFLEVFAYLLESTRSRGIIEREMSEEYLKCILLDGDLFNSLKEVIENVISNL